MLSKISAIEDKLSGSFANPAHIITISAWKGGAGKSSIALNLAFSIANKGKKTLLADIDGTCPAISSLIGDQTNAPSISLLLDDIIHHKKRFDFEKLYTADYGLRTVLGVNDYKMVTGASKSQITKLGRALINAPGYEYIILDTGAGKNEISEIMSALSDQIIWITDMSGQSVDGVAKQIVDFINNGLYQGKNLGIVVNNIPSVFKYEQSEQKKPLKQRKTGANGVAAQAYLKIISLVKNSTLINPEIDLPKINFYGFTPSDETLHLANMQRQPLYRADSRYRKFLGSSDQSSLPYSFAYSIENLTRKILSIDSELTAEEKSGLINQFVNKLFKDKN